MDSRQEVVLDALKKAVQEGGLSRREALKFIALGGVGLALEASQAHAAAPSSGASGKILIIGGGGGGIDVAARLFRSLENPDITIVDPNEIHHYQPGYTLIGCGVYAPEHVLAQQADYIPKGAKWVKDVVREIHPEQNLAITQKGEKLTYDYLVLAPGLQMNWENIEGLSRTTLGQNGVHSVYDYEGSIRTWEGVQQLAKNGGKAIFCDINTPIKCGGAPKKINMMTEAYLRRQGARDRTEVEFMTTSGRMFGTAVHNKTLEEIYQNRNIKVHYRHLIKAIDRQGKRAIFEKTTLKERKEYDEVLKEEAVYQDEVKEQVNVAYDFLHVVPPMSAPDFVKNSPLAWDKGSAAEGGWAMVDQYTLQHLKFKNIFGIGDVCGIPLGKTGGSVRKQAPIVAANLILVMEGKEPTHKHNGYTVCPLLSDYGLVLLAEFGYDDKLLPTIPESILDPGKERWIWWVMKCYILEPLYYHGMLRGIA